LAVANSVNTLKRVDANSNKNPNNTPSNHKKYHQNTQNPLIFIPPPAIIDTLLLRERKPKMTLIATKLQSGEDES